jgi:hypothetical protein
MEFMLLIYDDESSMKNATKEQMGEMFKAYGAYTEELKGAGAMRAGAPFQPSDTATTVQVRNGSRATNDGPHSANKEQLGGYYLIDCKDLDEALEWAAKIPSAQFGTIEVRPIMQM